MHLVGVIAQFIIEKIYIMKIKAYTFVILHINISIYFYLLSSTFEIITYDFENYIFRFITQVYLLRLNYNLIIY